MQALPVSLNWARLSHFVIVGTFPFEYLDPQYIIDIKFRMRERSDPNSPKFKDTLFVGQQRRRGRLVESLPSKRR